VARLAIEIAPAFEAWQAAARILVRQGVPPADVVWRERPGAPGPSIPEGPDPSIRVPRQFVDLARRVATHPDPARWGALYTVLWRLVHGAPDLMSSRTDPDVARVLLLDRDVASPASPAPEARPPSDAAGRAEPSDLDAPVDGRARETSAGMSASSSRQPPVRRPGGQQAPAQSPPPPGAGAFVPPNADIAALRTAAARCEGCDLHRHASRTVFSAGPPDARVVLVGEQPGDQEDLKGLPFVGPAGEVLDRALAEVGLARAALYVTNAVKHFKFVPRGKRRIHQTPTMTELTACRPWLEAELAIIDPEVLVCLGATASRALLGADFRLMRDHGRFMMTRWSAKTVATLHPSAVLRGEDEATQARLYAMLRDDLKLVASAVAT